MLKRLWILLVFTIVGFAQAQAVGEGKFLVWLADGSGPEGVSPSKSGAVGWMESNGTFTPITVDVPAGTSRVLTCATSADKSRVYFFVGQEEGTLYAINKGDITPVVLDRVRALTCLRGSFQLSPDGARLVYIDFEPANNADEFTDGRLRVVNTADLSRINLRENDVIDTTAFGVTNDIIAFVRLPETGSRNEALEAVINIYNGASSQSIAVLRPDADNACRFTNANLEVLPNNKLIAVLGHRCRQGGNTNTTFRIFTVDTNARDSFSLIASGASGGAFVPESRVNTIVPSQDGTRAIINLPDGIVGNSANVQIVDVASGTLTPVLGRGGWMTRYTQARAYVLDEPGYPTLSPDGRWYAFVESSPNNDRVLHVVDLSNMNVRSFPAPNRGDNIQRLTFTPDSRTLVYLQGGAASKENSIMTLVVDGGNPQSILRGRFGFFALSPNGNQVAIMEWQTVEDPTQPPYQSFSVIDLSNGAYFPVWDEGATITPEGKVRDLRFVYPLAWVPN